MSGEQDEQDDPDWGFDVIDGGDWSSEFESASGSDVSEFDLEDPGNLDWASFLEEAGLSLRPKVCDTSRLQDSGFRQVALRRLGKVGHRYGDVTGRTVPQLVSRREHGLCQRNPGFSPGHRASIGSRFIPNVPNLQAKYGYKAFCGQYSRDGNVFLTACQDQRIRVYDTRRGSFRLKRTIQAPNIEWSILDTALSSDGRYVVYSGWSDSIYVCEVLKKEGSVHQLPFSHDGFASCVFSLTFSHDDSEIMGAANDGCLYVFDRRRQERTLCIHSHSNDANAVTFADASSQILFSGGDDGLLKVWDRRMLSEENPREVGILLGHFDARRTGTHTRLDITSNSFCASTRSARQPVLRINPFYESTRSASQPVLHVRPFYTSDRSTRQPVLHVRPIYTSARSTRQTVLHVRPFYTSDRSTRQPVLHVRPFCTSDRSTRQPVLHVRPFCTSDRSTRQPVLHVSPFYTSDRSTRQPVLHVRPFCTSDRSTRQPVLHVSPFCESTRSTSQPVRRVNPFDESARSTRQPVLRVNLFYESTRSASQPVLRYKARLTSKDSRPDAQAHIHG
uniref:Uncharacterized protein n=1 Tax=Branchiostoma floridae TaxID=7739 RepID=C3ZZG8_BRAFL|eukprot:XP_002586066.1 hypothetical protein BRAFLDRAFT_107298 [Branchiostoma floridae]